MNHSITECIELEGILKSHPAQPSCRKQGHLQLEQAAQGAHEVGP